MRFFLPTFFGDIRLEDLGQGQTSVVFDRMTPTEEAAMTTLRAHAEKKKWTAKEVTWESGKWVLEAEIGAVQKILVKALKPGRKTVAVVRIADGMIEEIAESDFGDTEVRTASGKVIDKKDPKTAGTAVAAPTQGCPAPDFERAELKARDVLFEFLSPEQREDFTKFNRFVSIGASGSRYMVTSRHNREALEIYRRSLYDLDLQMDYCVHDWTVPAPEEMLALHVLLQIPSWERYLRHMEN